MTHPLKAKLGSKTILIMDDEFNTVGDYRIRLEDVGITSEHVETLEEALTRIEQKSDQYGLILLDLKMPAAKDHRLQTYANQLGLQPTSRNHGRCIGLYLWQQRARLKLPYCYLSALTHCYGSTKGEFAGQETKFIIDKAGLLHSHLPTRLVQVLADWAALPDPATGGIGGGQP